MSDYHIISPSDDALVRANAFLAEYAALCGRYGAEIGPVTHGDTLGVLVDDEPVLTFAGYYKPTEVSPEIIRRRVRKSP